MLAEYALVPDIFDSSCYSSPAVCDVHLSQLKRVVLEEALVRDLHDGEWTACVKNRADRWHQRAKELHRKLVVQKRLRRVPAAQAGVPATDRDWCVEAIASHRLEPLDGVIASNGVAAEFPGEPVVASIERLPNALWWQDRGPSVRLRRQTEDYIRCLKLVLSHANSLMFIDPHLDPERHGYEEIGSLLAAAARASVQPRIEIHRVCYMGSGPAREIIPATKWERVFKDILGPTLSPVGLAAEVFIWDDFHDRYLITDLIGMTTPNGFDVSHNPSELTTWTRLGRKDRDDIQREFHPASRRHAVHHRFMVGVA